MRRLLVVVAMFGLSISSRASADPFEHISQRLEQYDRQLDEHSPSRKTAPRRPAGGRDSEVRKTSGIATSDSRLTGPSMVTRPVSQQPQSTAPEEVEPVPMPQGEFEQFEQPTDGYYPGEWEGPANDYYPGGSCNMGCGWCKPGFWGRAEYLAWWVRGANTPALVTTSPDGTLPGTAGRLPDATVLFGNQRINTRGRSGGRFTFGYWFDPCNQLGIENTFFFIGGQNQGYTASSSGSPILARPFYDPTSASQDAILLAYPDASAGGINITSGRTIYSNEINLRRALYSDCCRRIDVLAGYRYLRLSENLNIYSNATTLSGDASGTQFNAQDLFGTGNNFNGGQLGLNLQFTRGLWTWDILGKVALGGVSQHATISGQTVITPSGGSATTYTGGVLALPSNIGQYNQTVFGVLPEFDFNLRYQWSPLWRVNIGYTFMALTNVLRPGDQISLNVDPAQFPPPSSTGNFPAFAFNSSDIWLQGLNFGLECNF